MNTFNYQNIGNNCYANSVVQALYHCPIFVSHLLSVTKCSKGSKDYKCGVCTCQDILLHRSQNESNLSLDIPQSFITELLPSHKKDQYEDALFFLEELHKRIFLDLKHHRECEKNIFVQLFGDKFISPAAIGDDLSNTLSRAFPSDVPKIIFLLLGQGVSVPIGEEYFFRKKRYIARSIICYKNSHYWCMSKVDNVWHRFDDQEDYPVEESFKENGDVTYRALIFEEFDPSILRDKSKKSSSTVTKIVSDSSNETNTNTTNTDNTDSEVAMDVDDAEYSSTRIKKVYQEGVNKLDPQHLYTRSQRAALAGQLGCQSIFNK